MRAGWHAAFLCAGGAGVPSACGGMPNAGNVHLTHCRKYWARHIRFKCLHRADVVMCFADFSIFTDADHFCMLI